MEEKLLDGDATDNLESLHNVRLTALLHDLMKQGGRLRAIRDAGGQLQDGGLGHRLGAAVGAPAGGSHETAARTG